MRTFLSIIIFIFSLPLCYCQTWSTLGAGINGGVNALVKDTLTNQLYIGGQFTMAGSNSANCIAKWNGTQWDSLGSGMGGIANAFVRALAMYNGELYAGGYFTTAGGNPANYIAKWNGTSWMPVGTGMNNQVSALAVYNGELYAGGLFTVAGGNPTNYIAKWNGATWSSIGTGVDNMVLTLLAYNGKLYTGGWFSNAGGNTANYIASWNGSAWSSVGLGTNGKVGALGIYNGNLYLGGGFTMAGNVPANNIASYNDSAFNSLGTGVDNSVYALSVYNCELYAGGFFSNAGGIPLNNNKIAKWNGTAWGPVGSAITASSINALSVYNGDLYVGGTIFVPGNNILKWNVPIPPHPNVSFFANDSNIQFGKCIQFTNTSTTGTTAQWSFQGGIPASSIAINPIIYYPNTGIYDVTLIATNCSGADTLVKNAYIHVDSTIHYIPYGTSTDFFVIPTPPHTAIYEGSYYIYYYKPLTYDSASPILFFIHGNGGTGAEYSNLQAIADRRKALIVAPNMHIGILGFQYISELLIDSISGCAYVMWMPEVFKQIYRHVLQREKRDSVPVYLTGFSGGGQFTTRYMLFRQFSLDSIPLRMAVSVNPANYTLCTDTFNNTQMLFEPYRCGLSGRQHLIMNCAQDTPLVADFICNAHIVQYYNENYGVLIGTADTVTFSGFCPSAQGTNRYDRAKNFYNFSDTNAITRGTILQWRYDSVIGVAHDGYAMYNTKRNVTDSSTIAESLLFDTPWHPVPSLAPIASFTADTTIVSLPNATVQFTNNSINATSYSWDFGDSYGSTNINPSHTYYVADTFTVKLKVTGGSGCENEMLKRNYIIVKSSSGISQISNLKSQISVYPNPTSGKFTIQIGSGQYAVGKEYKTEIYNVLGEKIYSSTLNSNLATLNLSESPIGVYFMQLKVENKTYSKKILISR